MKQMKVEFIIINKTFINSTWSNLADGQDTFE